MNTFILGISGITNNCTHSSPSATCGVHGKDDLSLRFEPTRFEAAKLFLSRLRAGQHTHQC
eukprot:m.151745 g.151745  ORF g.151745 m.151745 type:complete len:61 (+) comp14257_c0_seq4:552-734(+)